jgi:hypothetical protein
VTLKIEAAELQKHRLFIGSPQHGGNCHSIFTSAFGDVMLTAGRYGLPVDTYLLWNESMIPRARNYIADRFMQSEADHLFFWDADIGCANHMDVFALLILQAQNPQYEIIGAPYKKKQLGGGYAFNPGKFKVDMDAKEPQQIEELATGFMLIHRSVFERFDEAFPQYRYLPDTSPYDYPNDELTQFFQGEIEQPSRRYVTEDYWFTRRCAEIGIRTWLCPWMKLRHAGTFVFE